MRGAVGVFVAAVTCASCAHEKGAMKKANEEVVVLDTSMGKIVLRLFPDRAPRACENFTSLAKTGYYNGVVFHRVISNFMIQGGDPTGTGRGGKSTWGGTFEDEFSPELRHDRPGILSMANAGPNTNGSQFFITLAPTPWLDNRHTIFGEVIEGMDVVNGIGAVQTGPDDKPLTNVVMKKVTVEYR